MMRISPENYFTLQNSLQDESQFKEGIKIGAVLILIGVVVGALIAYLARK